MKMHTTIVIFLIYIMNSTNLLCESPYNSTWGKEGVIVGVDIGLIFLSEILSEDVDTLSVAQINVLDKNDINSFDRSAASNWSPEISKSSDYLVLTCLLSPLALFLAEDIRSDVGTVTVMYLENIMTVTFVTSSIKTASRIRPFAYNPNAPMEDKLELKQDLQGSFPSGHTAWAFSSAVFLSTVYSDYFPDSKWTPYIWGGSLLAASTVGYFRYASGYHYPTDVLAGAVLGSAIGYLIPYFHRSENDSQFSLTPVTMPNYYALNLSYKF